jgi:hypothetical protein
MAQLEYNLPVLILGKNPLMATLDHGAAAAAAAATSGGGSSSTGAGGGVDTVTFVENTAPAMTGTIVASTGGLDTSKNASSSTDGIISLSPNSNAVSSSLLSSSSSLPLPLPYKKLVVGNAVPDVVELLVALGVVQVEDTRETITTPNDVMTSNNEEHIRQPSAHEPRYAIVGGQPRQFVVTPSNLRLEIAKAHDEIQASFRRQELLREALDPNTLDKKAAKILEQIAIQYPQAVADDPVYVTALRNMHVDVISLLGKFGSAAAGAAAGGGSTSGNSTAGTAPSIKMGGERLVTLGGKGTGTTRRRESTASMGKKKPKKKAKTKLTTLPPPIHNSTGDKSRTQPLQEKEEEQANGSGPLIDSGGSQSRSFTTSKLSHGSMMEITSKSQTTTTTTASSSLQPSSDATPIITSAVGLAAGKNAASTPNKPPTHTS